MKTYEKKKRLQALRNEWILNDVLMSCRNLEEQILLNKSLSTQEVLSMFLSVIFHCS